jgi:hypothetical protein
VNGVECRGKLILFLEEIPQERSINVNWPHNGKRTSNIQDVVVIVSSGLISVLERIPWILRAMVPFSLTTKEGLPHCGPVICYCTGPFLPSHVHSMRSYCNGENISSEILMDYILSVPLNTKKKERGLFESHLYVCMYICARLRTNVCICACALTSLVSNSWVDFVHILNSSIYLVPGEYEHSSSRRKGPFRR